MSTERQARMRALLASTRSNCIRIITRLVGGGGVQAFLKCQQPALSDHTGAQLLQNEPGELLKRLRWLEAEAQSGHDEALSDPICDRIPQAAPKHKIRGVLGILDQLDKRQSTRRSKA